MTTGKSTREVMRVVEESGGVIVAACGIVNRGGGETLDVPFNALVRLQIDVFDPTECPLCARGIALVKPGSRPRAT